MLPSPFFQYLQGIARTFPLEGKPFPTQLSGNTAVPRQFMGETLASVSEPLPNCGLDQVIDPWNDRGGSVLSNRQQFAVSPTATAEISA